MSSFYHDIPELTVLEIQHMYYTCFQEKLRLCPVDHINTYVANWTNAGSFTGPMLGQ